jgi:threonine synthase
MGLPIGAIVLATNANKTIPEYFDTLQWIPRASVKTLASAMDVGDPSNMERLRSMVGEADVLRDRLGVFSVEDEQIEAGIRKDFAEFGFATCPHTAIATQTWRQLGEKTQQNSDWILVATAHPAKFETIVEPLIGTTVPLPDDLSAILSRPSRSVSIDPQLDKLAAALERYFG